MELTAEEKELNELVDSIYSSGYVRGKRNEANVDDIWTGLIDLVNKYTNIKLSKIAKKLEKENEELEQYVAYAKNLINTLNEDIKGYKKLCEMANVPQLFIDNIKDRKRTYIICYKCKEAFLLKHTYCFSKVLQEPMILIHDQQICKECYLKLINEQS